jgi:perosamine synthetase
MKLIDSLKLIPRNNWDYGFGALFRSIAGVRHNLSPSPNTEKHFQQPPIWTNSGRTSLYAILKSLELPDGSKVGVPLFCCAVVFDAICQAGLTPKFLDSNLSDCNISVEDLRKKSADLAAVVVVHMFGNPCDMGSILAAAAGMPVIEDCAQSIFSTYKGQPTGLLSTASFFSFRCGKYISAGEGSAIFSRDPDLRHKIEKVVDAFEGWSMSKLIIDSMITYLKASMYNRPWYGIIGYPIGMRIDKKLNLTAKNGFKTGKIAPTHHALIENRIAGFQEKINQQREHAHLLLKSLSPGIFSIPAETDDSNRNWFQFPLRFQNTQLRDAMADHLFKQGIDTSKYLDDIVEEARSNYGYRGDCPQAELLSKTILLVPIHYKLHEADIKHIAASIHQGVQRIINPE